MPKLHRSRLVYVSIIIATEKQNGKTQSQLCKEYGVSQSALGKWIKQYSITTQKDHTERLICLRQVLLLGTDKIA